MNKERYSNPYLIGALLGLVMLSAFYTMGRGLGASSPIARVTTVVIASVAPDHAKENPYLKKYFRPDRGVLNDWLVFLVIGASLGGLFSASMASGGLPYVAPSMTSLKIKGMRAAQSLVCPF